MINASANKTLTHHLGELEGLAVAAKKAEDIDNIASRIREFGRRQDYRFKNGLYGLLALIAISILIISFLPSFIQAYGNVFWLRALGVLIFIISAYVVYRRFQRVSAVGNAIYVRAVAIQAGLVREYNFNGRHEWMRLSRHFVMFNCGDENQKITAKYSGEITSADGSACQFDLLRFSYVIVRRRLVSSAKGGARMKTTREIKEKYALVTQIPTFTKISINVARFQHKWDSASSRFNDTFKVYALSEIEAAKFFDPKTVLRFVERYRDVKSLDVTADGKICVELPNQAFPMQMRSPNLRNSDRFLQYLATPSALPVLEKAKDMIAYITEQSS